MAISASQRRGNWAEQRALRLLQGTGWQLLAAHPHYQHCSLELVLALVPQPPAREPVRWIRCWG